MTEIESAILKMDLQKVRSLLEENPSLIEEKDIKGRKMALLAAGTGNLSLIRYIVEYSRASMDVTDPIHRNMLHYATESGNLAACRYLVEKVGLSPVTGDEKLVTPYEIAYRAENRELCVYYQERTGAAYEDMYHNPVRTGFFPDPSVVRVGHLYYMVNSSFVYFPCIPISRSADLVHWEIIGYAITNPEWARLDHLEGGRGYWAPDISYYQGRFYITATYRMNDDGTVYREQIIVSSEKPEGPYSKPAIIHEDGIDPSLFTDDDGRRYMLLNRGARILELNREATQQISPAQLLYYGNNKRAPEGPHLLKKDGFYYLLQAEGGTGPGHRITVSRSRELLGNYEPCPYNPIMRQTDPDAGLQRCGHGKLVQTQNGQWYMVYLCGRKLRPQTSDAAADGYSMLGRETALDPVTWTADGWPIVNRRQGPSCLQIMPDLPKSDILKPDSPEEKLRPESAPLREQAMVQLDDFTADKLSAQWTFVRPPVSGQIRIAESCLQITGSVYDLDTMLARNIVLRRQQHFSFRATCVLQMPALQPGQDAGLVCYYDENTFVKFGVFSDKNGVYRLKVQEHIGDRDIWSADIPVDPLQRQLVLQVETRGLTRSFYYGQKLSEELQEAVQLSNVYYLCDEGLKKGKRFTGAMVGMYAYGGRIQETLPLEKKMRVSFDSFSYEPLA